MSLFEYSKWDGSQKFLPQSADKVFDQLSEYILQYGDNVLRDLENLDEDELPELVELIEKEGLIERDKEGKWQVTPKGIRRIQDKALGDLFQTFRRDSVGRHDTQQKGEGTVQLEDTRPYVYGDSLANLNMHETLKNAYVRQGGGVPIRLSHEDYVVHETEFQSRCATVVLIDMSGSMGRYGKYYTTKKVAIALQAMVRAQYPQDAIEMIGFYTFATPLTERQLLNSAPKPVSLWDSRVNLRFDLDRLPARVPQHFTNIHAGLRLAQPPDAAVRGQQADHRDHRRRAHGPSRGARGRAHLSPRREDRDPYAQRSEALRQRRHPRLQLRPDRRLLLSRSGELRAGDGAGLQRRRRLLLGGRPRQVRFRELHRRKAYEAV